MYSVIRERFSAELSLHVSVHSTLAFLLHSDGPQPNQEGNLQIMLAAGAAEHKSIMNIEAVPALTNLSRPRFAHISGARFREIRLAEGRFS